jgi:hypothetical protein
MVEVQNLRYILAGVASVVILFFTYPMFVAGTPFIGQAPVWWLLLPIGVGIALAYVFKQDSSYFEKLKSIAQKGEEAVVLLEPMECWDIFCNMIESSQVGRLIGKLQWVKFVDHWLFIVPTIDGEKYIYMNGIKGKPLNPEVVTLSKVKELGFEDAKDKERSGKNRLVYDILRNPRMDTDKLLRLTGDGGVINEKP